MRLKGRPACIATARRNPDTPVLPYSRSVAVSASGSTPIAIASRLVGPSQAPAHGALAPPWGPASCFSGPDQCWPDDLRLISTL